MREWVIGLRRTKKAWFGPKRWIGWGWTATSWEGAVVSAVFLALILVATAVARSVVATIAVVAAFTVVVLLTGDPPGGPSR